MSDDNHQKKTGDHAADAADRKLDATSKRTSKKTADEAVVDAPMAKKYADNFQSFSDGTKAVNPLVLEDSKTGEKLYDASDRKGHSHTTTGGDHKGPFQFKVTVPVPDYKPGLAPGLPKFVMVEVGPSDNQAFEHHYKEELAGKDLSKLSDADREKYRNAAICDVLIDKYQDSLTKQSLQECRNMPQVMKGLFLAGTALEDGTVVGGCRAALHKIVVENELGNLATGAGAGILLGEVVKLGLKIHPWTRAAALALQAGGIGLLAKQVTDIGSKEVGGLLNSFPALQEVIRNPNEETFTHAKMTCEKEIGPPTGDGALLAVGFVASQATEKGVIAAVKSAKGKVPGKIIEPVARPAEKVEASGALKAVELAEPLFSVEEFGQLRRMKIGDHEEILAASGAFFKGKTCEGRKAVSPAKVHVLTDSPQDLQKLQAVLIPELKNDPVLAKHVAEWKTMDPLFALGKPGRKHALAPDGVEQGAKAFTIYTKTAEEALLVNKRIDEICHARGLGLKEPIKTGNCDTVHGASRRVGIVRDTFPMTRDQSGHYGAAIDHAAETSICKKLNLPSGERLNQNQLHVLETQCGIEKGLLSYDHQGSLMLRATGENGRPYHGGWYVDESDAVKQFGHLTERPALYSLYKWCGLDPAEVAVRSGGR